MTDTAIFDIDGTLIDSNYQHAIAWFRAFRRFDVTCPLWEIHRAVGMGGDFLVPEVGGKALERDHGDEVRDAQIEEFDRLIDEVQPFEGAHELLREVRDRGFSLVLASSGEAKHVEQFLDLLDARDLADAWTTSDDADRSKPEPDLVASAMDKAAGTTGVMIGDSTWDIIAAGKLGIPCIAVRSGGYGVDELRQAGALRVFDSLVDLGTHLDDTPLRTPTS